MTRTEGGILSTLSTVFQIPSKSALGMNKDDMPLRLLLLYFCAHTTGEHPPPSPTVSQRVNYMLPVCASAHTSSLGQMFN